MRYKGDDEAPFRYEVMYGDGDEQEYRLGSTNNINEAYRWVGEVLGNIIKLNQSQKDVWIIDNMSDSYMDFRVNGIDLPQIKRAWEQYEN